MLIYKLLFPSALLSSSMLLSRGVSFYLFVLVSGISILIFSLKDYCITHTNMIKSKQY